METRLRAAFERSGLTQTALAKRCGLETYTVGRILAGVLPESFERFERVAEALGVSWQWLLVGEHATAATPPNGGPVEAPESERQGAKERLRPAPPKRRKKAG